MGGFQGWESRNACSGDDDSGLRVLLGGAEEQPQQAQLAGLLEALTGSRPTPLLLKEQRDILLAGGGFSLCSGRPPCQSYSCLLALIVMGRVDMGAEPRSSSPLQMCGKLLREWLLRPAACGRRPAQFCLARR